MSTEDAGLIKKHEKGKGYESIPRELLQDSELSLEAIGLLAHLISLPPGFKVHKTFLYRSFKKNRTRSIRRIWNELVDEGYIIQFRKRAGKKFVYQYYFSSERFTKEDRLEITREMNELGFDFWTLQNEQSNLNSSKRSGNRLTTNKLTTNKLTTEGFDEDDEKINKKTSAKINENQVVTIDVDFNKKLSIVLFYLQKHNVPKEAGDDIVKAISDEPYLLDGKAIEQQMKFMLEKQKEDPIYDFSAYFLHGLRNIMKNKSVDSDQISTELLREKLHIQKQELPAVSLYNWMTGEDPEDKKRASSDRQKSQEAN